MLNLSIGSRPQLKPARKELRRRLQLIRARLGLTRKDAAQRIGISAKQLKRLERGKSQPLYETLIAIAKGYAIPAWVLLPLKRKDTILVLLVDDDPPVLRGFTQVIRGFNDRSSFRFIVETAAHGQEALDKAEAHAPNLILSDILMPQMSGVELIRELRSSPRTMFSQVIGISASVDPDLADQVKEAGADLFLPKPLEGDRLWGALCNVFPPLAN